MASTAESAQTAAPEDRSALGAAPKERSSTDWEERWRLQTTPWDLGHATFALQDLIQDKPDWWPKSGRVLVPGCGAAHDVFFVAAATELDVTGLDLSSTAIQVCEKRRSELDAERSVKERIHFVEGDFFQFESRGPFDLIFDYTFLCALPPELRPSWAARMAVLLKPGGTLVTLIYPIGTHEGGPPFAVSPELYEGLLLANFELLRMSECRSAPSRIGREKLAIWKRK